MTNTVNQNAPGVRFGDKDVPISWIRDYGQGRLFYSSFGHNHEIYWNAAILKHFLAGIQFALGDLQVETTPLPFDVERALRLEALDVLLQKIAGYEYGKVAKPWSI